MSKTTNSPRSASLTRSELINYESWRGPQHPTTNLPLSFPSSFIMKSHIFTHFILDPKHLVDVQNNVNFCFERYSRCRGHCASSQTNWGDNANGIWKALSSVLNACCKRQPIVGSFTNNKSNNLKQDVSWKYKSAIISTSWIFCNWNGIIGFEMKMQYERFAIVSSPCLQNIIITLLFYGVNAKKS